MFKVADQLYDWLCEKPSRIASFSAIFILYIAISLAYDFDLY